MNETNRERMVRPLISFSHAGSVLSEDEKRKYADLIVEIFELKVKGLL
jgi:hypothetical protein